MATIITSFGCRLNAHEAEIIRRKSDEAGLAAQAGDTIIFNTCAVTAEAVRQAGQAIRKARRDRPGARIIVTGCAAQTTPEMFAAMAEVDLVLGNEDKLHRQSYRQFADFGVNRQEKLRVGNIMDVRENAPHMIALLEGKTRAFVQVQNGCDHRCTFCIIPYGRGPSRSVPPGAVVEQIKQLCAGGHREVVLTGVDLTSYGPDLPGGIRLGRLVGAILRNVPELARLRLSSIDSIEIDEELQELLIHEKRLMPHLHLSLQSGDNIILKRMKRRHLREQALQFCHELQARRPEMIFGADLIAGFPTETEEMFENTRRLIADCRLTYLHIFPFSPRAGTPAARMPQLARTLVKNRAAALRREAAKAYQNHLQSLLGSEQILLMEQNGQGRCENYAPAALQEPAPAAPKKEKTPQNQNNSAGELVRCRIIAHNGDRLIAERLAGAA
ncbi:MAG: tRNA (N(6)-L-threonylcarbamoyladenosine(37)-C(2))-methylthiotransferase MtaB [Candidatus Tokpelaia sp.]|uniref:tRNA (N(6)-L-threonylcarbamoyladenosine(37)-C(2))- methylthiotransferase MtaB n=1 Tax=Candidatus Tokpelaia sp. TaxID=2233777 RepID=UPI0012388497|nr:tRNA (N(6)-L-threonylcarbamoyladenosine(37)-C(2))-methylthiotransferase MtaB [Candidatus Tokpelaia sp.]KAA6206033.1 MAG: tRNA (N(6)-L-threonylcarbamoyladenosine(37)-C(2))-methylthiotransferase MtaB [Candidatus Tokpelaia sp.]KAA6206181.1 MAG: tRNA (N(6)-L-threonylcarbamoyladenosine(37)-C(2))-methylthiotransferase MtaB [Candidatus Tokpelaia sp.]KAA6406078.1 tRNA (N(6)-L-threonylcarbamoyladenosine(37)-C(2))-methylthiotransferase MtaB [Candidatus Tokpelaia sp.]